MSIVIKNYTKRDIKIIRDGIENIFWACGEAVAEAVTTPVGDVRGIPVTKTQYGAVVGLPPEKKDVVYIVSAIAARAAKEAGRTDCFVPSEAVLDADRNVIGYKSLGIV